MDIRTQTSLLACIVATALGLSMVAALASRPGADRLLGLRLHRRHLLPGRLPPEHLPLQWPRGLAGAGRGGSPAAGRRAGALGGAGLLPGVPRRAGPGPAHQPSGGTLLARCSGCRWRSLPLANSPWGLGAVTVWAVGALLLSVSLLIRRVRRSDSPTERARLTYLAIGAAASLLFSALDGLPLLGVPFPTLGPVVTTLYLFFLAQTLLRLRLMDLHELLGKVASQTVLAVMLAAVFTVLTAWVHGNTSLYLFNTVLAAFVMCILLEPLRVKVEAQVVHIFFRERSELLRSLGALRARVANVIDPTDAAGLILDSLERPGGSPTPRCSSSPRTGRGSGGSTSADRSRCPSSMPPSPGAARRRAPVARRRFSWKISSAGWARCGSGGPRAAGAGRS